MQKGDIIFSLKPFLFFFAPLRLCVSIFLAFSLTLLPSKTLSAFQFKEMAAFTAEHAMTTDQLAWGLMGRHSLPKDHGMIFHFPFSHPSVWMFNCYIDLSIAFLNEKGIILQIKELKAYPKMMDPRRKITKVQEINTLYPPKDPVIRFFQSRAQVAPPYTKYAIEMNKNWFNERGIRAGDLVQWDAQRGHILRLIP